MLYPSPPLAAALHRSPELEGVVYELLCGITGREIREENRVYGGGLHKIEPKELSRVSAETFAGKIPDLRSPRLI